jgi:hypothetical protein
LALGISAIEGFSKNQNLTKKSNEIKSQEIETSKTRTSQLKEMILNTN